MANPYLDAITGRDDEEEEKDLSPSQVAAKQIKRKEKQKDNPYLDAVIVDREEFEARPKPPEPEPEPVEEDKPSLFKRGVDAVREFLTKEKDIPEQVSTELLQAVDNIKVDDRVDSNPFINELGEAKTSLSSATPSDPVIEELGEFFKKRSEGKEERIERAKTTINEIDTQIRAVQEVGKLGGLDIEPQIKTLELRKKLYNEYLENPGADPDEYVDVNLDRKELPEGYTEPGFFGQLTDGFMQGFVNMLASSAGQLESVSGQVGFIAPSEAAQKAKLHFESELTKHPEWEKPEDIGKWEDPNFYARLVGEGVPSIVGSIVVATAAALATGGGAAVGVPIAFLYSFLQEGGAAYREAEEFGLSKEDAAASGNTIGLINGLIETIPVFGWLDNKIGREATGEIIEEMSETLTKRILAEVRKRGFSSIKNFLEEGTQEAVQEVVNNAVVQSYDEDRSLWDGVLEAFAGGGILGGLTGTFRGDVAEVVTKQQEEKQDGEPEVKPTVKVIDLDEKIVIEKELQPLADTAKGLQSAKDFATTEGTTEEKQIGVIKPGEIVIRDPVDKTTDEYKNLVKDIKENGIKEPVIVQVKEDGTTETTEGSHRVTAALEVGADVPVIVTKGNIEGLSTINEFFNKVKAVPDEKVETKIEEKARVDEIEGAKFIEEAKKFESAEDYVEDLRKALPNEEQEIKRQIFITQLSKSDKTSDGWFKSAEKFYNGELELKSFTEKEIDNWIKSNSNKTQQFGFITDEVKAKEQLSDLFLKKQPKKPDTKPVKPLKTTLEKKKTEIDKIKKEGAPKPTLEQDPQKKFDEKGKKKEPIIKKGKGAIFDRAYEQLRLETNVEDNFDSISLRSQAKAATNFMEKNPKEAIEISFRQKPPPKGIRFEAINIATSKQALANGDMQLYTDLVAARSIVQSRNAQGLGIERLINSLATDTFVKQVFNSRLQKLSTQAAFKSKFKSVFKKGGRIKLGLEVVTQTVEAVKNKIDNKVKAKLESAQSIIDSLIC